MEKATLQVQGMSCNHCVQAVENAVRNVGGAAKVDLAGKSVAVEYDQAKTSLTSIKQAIEDQGYDVV
ncbi:copper ion binding protein [Cohnella sp. GCM10027633]|uniref:copper ion binding protein n=1 Tax=unclassified Cohnella TaxID=2636738 RepID=UPI00363AA57A